MWIDSYLYLSVMVVRLFQFEDDLVFPQTLLLQFLDFLSIQAHLFAYIIVAESCACFFDPIVKTLNGFE